MSSKIIYTKTDEAPALATYALLPIVQRFTAWASIAIETADISVASRVLSAFPERMKAAEHKVDTLAQLGDLAKTPEANIIKLPNVSASTTQLVSAIKELQGKGFDLPDFPATPSTPEEQEIYAKYAKVLGSAVNPVLREGNSDRRVAKPVKEYAMKNPHSMGKWSPDSRCHVAHMTDGDYYGSEQSHTMASAGSVRIELAMAGGDVKVLKPSVQLQAGEVIDSSMMSVRKLRAFYEREFSSAKAEGLMTSLHLKATMMKVSDPIFFGHAVSVFFSDVYNGLADKLAAAKISPNSGLGQLYDALPSMSSADQSAIKAALESSYAKMPKLAMVDSDKGITNLHVSSDVIIDASMPVVVRDSGKMWNKEGELEDVKCIIPDRCYATMYDAIIQDCKVNGQFDVTTMGNVANVGLMAQKAEEYGSHDKTFELPAAGTVRVVDNESGAVLMQHEAEAGDVWRMCQTKDAPIKDWVRLAVSRARATGAATTFWLDEKRAHDASIIAKVRAYLPEHDTSGLDISIMPPVEAITATCARARAGKDSVSVTGNVLRDYLTDLFPIIELGTSAKMLSIVPLLAGGGLFETGAGGSAPKHVQQFVKEGHLRWDSLGEYLALAVSLEDLGAKTSNAKASELGAALNEAIGKLLDNNKSPSRKVKQLDNRGSTFYIALYWAEALAAKEPAFATLAKELQANESTIVQELIDCQGPPVELGGYWMPDPELCAKAMRPSPTLEKVLSI